MPITIVPSSRSRSSRIVKIEFGAPAHDQDAASAPSWRCSRQSSRNHFVRAKEVEGEVQRSRWHVLLASRAPRRLPQSPSSSIMPRARGLHWNASRAPQKPSSALANDVRGDITRTRRLDRPGDVHHRAEACCRIAFRTITNRPGQSIVTLGVFVAPPNSGQSSSRQSRRISPRFRDKSDRH